MVYWKTGDLPPIFLSELCQGVSKMRIVSEHGVFEKLWYNGMSSKFFDQNCSKTLLRWEFWRTKGIEKKGFPQGSLIRKIQKKIYDDFLVFGKKNGVWLPIFPSKLFQETSKTIIFWKHGVLRNIDFLPFFSIKTVPSLS